MKKINLTSSYDPTSAFLDMMGGNTPEKGVVELNISNLHPFSSTRYPIQPFRMYSQHKLEELASSIKVSGILSPIIVRPLPDNSGYQILAGHNRTAAAKLAGLESVPCIVNDVDDDTAIIIMTATNLQQRDKLLYSEKAFAYKMQLDALKHQGKRNDLSTSRTLCTKSDSGEIVAEQNNESKRNIQYFIRLTYLIQPLLDKVDEERIPFRAGVNLSYLKENEQQCLVSFCDAYELHINLKQSEQLKKLSENELITEQVLDSVFNHRTPLQKKTLRLPMNDIHSYFHDMDDDEIVKQILEIVKQHYSVK